MKTDSMKINIANIGIAKIGIAAENRPQEKRVAILPRELKKITERHEVLVEKGAGLGLAIPDTAYIKAGCKMGSKEEVYGCDLVVRLKEPKIEELRLMHPGAIIMSMMHLRCSEELEKALNQLKLIAIPMDMLKAPTGRRRIEAFEDTGRLGMEYGFKLWGKDPATATVKIMGYGNLAAGAIRCAARKFAKLEILNKHDLAQMEKHLPGTDILVDAINRPYRREVEKEPAFVTREMLKLLKPGSVIIDLISNPENHGIVETMHPTFLDDPYYIVDGIYHSSLWGWPGLDPEAVTRRYSIQLRPILRNLANKGLEKCDTFIKNAAVFPK